MKKLIRKKLIESLATLTEVAISINDLPPTIGLFIPKKDYLILYDYKADKVYGMISFDKENDMKYYYVGAVAAEKGIGPLMYELAMTYSYPNGLTADRYHSTSDAAIKIHNFMYNRSDVKHVDLNSNNNSNKSLDSAYFYQNKPVFDALKKRGDSVLNQLDLEAIYHKSAIYFGDKLG